VVVTATEGVTPTIVRSSHRIATPTGHAVCRSCGRITRISLLPEEVGLLEALADHRPDGWSVDGASFSVTGLCASCRAIRTE
jgi:Fe2+ or Zn2+ uptake regulation protein